MWTDQRVNTLESFYKKIPKKDLQEFSEIAKRFCGFDKLVSYIF